MTIRFGLILLVGCSNVTNVGGGDDGPLGGSRTISGSVVDFVSGAPLDTATTVGTMGVLPAPKVTVQGADFTIEGVPDNSAFQIQTAAADHRTTFNPAVIVGDADQDGIKAATVSEAYLASLGTGFGVTPTVANGTVIVRLVDAAGAPHAGVAAGDLVLAGVTGAPHFLDASLAPAPAATASSASGYAVFFEVPPGDVKLAQAANAKVTLEMATSPVGAGAITLADVKVTDGAPPMLPKNVAFATQVAPIFQRRGCVACHSGKGPGKALGGLMLDGGTEHVWNELVTETTYRVVLATPETSKVLTMPSAENPPDPHPNITFTGPQDRDYLTILVWIREGAKNN